MECALEDGRLILAPVRQARRKGWAEGSRRIANAADGYARLVRIRQCRRHRAAVVTRPGDVTHGEVWLAVLDPTLGSEIQKTRPCVIISPPELHDFLRTVTVAPMTTGSRPAPYRIPIRFQRKNGLILLDQIRTLDRMRVVRRLGAVGMDTLRATLAGFREMFEE